MNLTNEDKKMSKYEKREMNEYEQMLLDWKTQSEGGEIVKYQYYINSEPVSADELIKDVFQKLKQRDEVLAILKDSYVRHEKHKRIFTEPKGDPFMIINFSVDGEENIKKIEEWLK